MRQFTRREEETVQIYFYCPEKMDRIISMLKRVDFTDIMFTTKFLCLNDELPEDDGSAKVAGHKIKFGKGWMGKNAEIHRISNILGEPKGITVSIDVAV